MSNSTIDDAKREVIILPISERRMRCGLGPNATCAGTGRLAATARRACLAFVLFTLVTAASSGAQIPGLLPLQRARDSASAASSRAADSSQAPGTIDPIEIPLRAARAMVRLGEIDAVLRQRGPVLEAQLSVIGLRDSLQALTEQQSLVPRAQLTRRAISSLSAEWDRWDIRVKDWAELIRRRVVELDSFRVELDRDEDLWRRTIAQAPPDLPLSAIQEAEGVARSIAAQREALKARQQELIAAEVALSKAAETIDAGLSSVGAAYANMRQQLFRIDSPALWTAIARGGWPGLFSTVATRWQQNEDAFARFVRLNSGRVLFHLLVTVALLVAVMRLRQRVAHVDATSAVPDGFHPLVDTRDHQWVLAHPRSSTMLMAALMTVLLYPAAPLIVYDVALLASALSLWWLLPSLLPPRMVSPARWGLALMAIDRVSVMLFFSTPWHRLVILGVAGAGLVLSVRARRRLRSLDYATRRLPVIRWAQRGVTLGVVLMAISIPSNLIGNVTLALIASAVVVLACLAILAVVGSTVINGLVAMAVDALQDDLKIVERKGPQILNGVSRLVRIAALVSWIGAALAAMLLWDPFKGLVSQFLAFGVSIGTSKLTIATVLLFFGIIWLGALIGRWIALVLEADVLERLNLPHGMPVTIASIVQYALTAIAFFLALAAAGVEIGQLTIIGGALSVGVGFGLQTIVNNFISGLILAFERPISIGDTIQLDNLEGVVIKIGIRASVIRIGTGADLIVPNGRLLDRDLINWTRSGSNRRIEIPLRVQAGVDPRAIVDLLPSIVSRHRGVSRTPAPTCLFLGFGDSSTDFVVRCWTDALDYRAVTSEISLEAEEALRNAGYSSPSSQRDLHLRSVSADVVAALGAHGAPPHPTGHTERAVTSP